jgi:hypothetical protein
MLHITRRTPLRRTILQLRQIFLTEARTFIIQPQNPGLTSVSATITF